MLTFIGAVIQHMFRVVTFRHPGTGLPSNRGGALYVLMVLWALSRIGFDLTAPAADGGFDALNSVAYVLAFLGVAAVFLRPPACALLMLVNTFSNSVAAGIRLYGITEPNVMLALNIWTGIALFVTLNRAISSALRAGKKNRTSEKN
jgi:hypothetical protein